MNPAVRDPADWADRGDLPRVSVVLPARNEARTIRAALEGLRVQTYPAELIDIVVIDGDSEDGTSAIVQEIAAADPRVRLLSNPGRITPIALNIGIRGSSGEVIARMDGHAIADARYIELGVAALAATGAWSVGGRMLKAGTTAQERANAVAASSPIGVGDSAHNFADRPRWVETVFLGIWPRWVFDRVGMFDEEFVRNQDDEHAARIHAAGGRIWYDPAMLVRYRPRSSLRSLFEQYRQYGYWKVRVFQKRPTAARWRHFVPAGWVLSVGLLAGLSPLSAAARTILFVLSAVYGLTLGVEAARHRRQADPARTWLSIAALHLGYGLGFLQGMRRFGPPVARRRHRAPQSSQTDRGASLLEIETAYREYQRSGRDRRWVAPRPGDVRSLAERDRWIAEQVRQRPHETILDVGCGTGSIALALDQAGLRPDRYIGVDIIAERIAVARHRVGFGEFLIGSADELPLEDASVDVALAITLFSSIRDPSLAEAVARELARVVRPSGCVVLYDLRYPSPTNPNVTAVRATDLRRMFPGWRISSRSMTLLPPIARGAIGSSALAHRVLASVPPLRSHLAAVLIRD